MTKEDIIRMAREAGIVVTGDAVLKLCQLVVDKEREECAKVCDGYSDGRHANMADLCAEAIRARGQA